MLADPFAVTFTWNPEPNEPLTVRFTDTSRLSTTWLWSFGDGETSTDQNPVHTYQEPGVYVVRLTSLTGMLEPLQERSAETTIEIVTPTPAPTGAVTTTPTSTPTQSRTPVADFSFSPQNGTAPLLVGFEDRSSAPDGSRLEPVRWVWDFGDLTATAEGRSVHHRFMTPGTYRTRLTVVFKGPTILAADLGGALSNVTTERTVQVEAAWLVIDPVGEIARGDALELTGSTNLAPGGQMLVEVLPSSYRPADTEQAGDVGGVTGTTRVAGDGTENTFRFTAETSGLLPDTYTATVRAVEADAIATTTFALVEHSTETPTTEITTLTTTPTTLPTTPPTILPTLEMPPSGSPPVAAFTWLPAATSGLRIRFTDASTGTVTARRWEFGDGNVSLERDPFHIYPVAGTYTVRLAVEGPEGVSSAYRAIVVGEPTTPPATPTVSPTATSGGGGDPFPWWLAAIAAVGLLAGGAALVRFGPGGSPVKTVPGLTVEPRGRLQRPGTEEPPGRDARIEIEVRGGMRRER